MQGIVGQASDFVEVVSKIDWTLLHKIWLRKIEKIKGDWRATLTLWYVFFHEHISPRTSSTVVRVRLSYEFRLEVFVRYARWRACQDSLSCWTRLALANEKEGELWRKVKTTLQSFAASTELECEDKSNSVVCQKKKNVLSLSCQLSAEEAYTTVSCNDSVVLSNRLSRCARKSENKRTCFYAGWPWGKRKSRLVWLDGIQFRSPNIFCTVVQCWQSKAKLRRSSTSDEDDVKYRNRLHTQLRREDFARSILPWRRAPDQRQRSVRRYLYIYIYIVTESQVNT